MARHLLIFDLDETLVHATMEQLERACDFSVPPYFIYLRPHIPEFLAALAPHYDFAVWSSSSRAYVDAVVNKVFGPAFTLQFAWAVERCIQRIDVQSNGYVFIKDLRKVQKFGYTLDRITMLDDSPEKLARQPRNLLRIAPYRGQADDEELRTVGRILASRAQRL